MKYENAKDILPRELFDALQSYAAGKLLYVPGTGGRRPWGDRTGYRRALELRNGEIRRKFIDGASIDSLADEYFLTPETVKKVVYLKKEKNDMELSDIAKLYYEEDAAGIEIITEAVNDDEPYYFLEAEVSYPDRKITLVVCDY